MAATYTLPGVLLSGLHAARPAANAVAAGTLYVETDTYQAYQSDGASTWTAWGPSYSGTGLSGGTPALTLGTSNSAGAAGTGIRTDATILAFDATVPAGLGTAAAGAATVAARRDHVHPGAVPWIVFGDNGRVHQAFSQVGASNRAIYQPILVPIACTITGVRVGIGTSSGNVCAALYDSGGSRVATSGSIASPGTAQRTLAFTGSYAAAAGRYYLGISADNGTVTFSCSNNATNLYSPADNPMYQNTAFPLPTSISSAGLTSVSPILGAVISGGYPT